MPQHSHELFIVLNHNIESSNITNRLHFFEKDFLINRETIKQPDTTPTDQFLLATTGRRVRGIP